MKMNLFDNMKKQAAAALIFLGLFQGLVFAQETQPVNDSILYAAREFIKANHFCALVTVDSTGQPHIRTMNPFPLDEDMVIWFATARKSRKASEIKKDERVCVYFADHSEAKGYVSITGKAVVIDDKELLIKKKRDYWESIPGWQDNFVLIKVVPLSVEVINYEHQIYNDPETLKAPVAVF